MKEMEIRIENVQSLVVAAVRATREFGDVSIWWRGHSVSTWVLRPLVYRVEDAGHQYERNIASRFIQRAAVRHQATPLSNDLAGWFFLMQHYGLPTRILDWTSSILIATYFAVRDDGFHGEDGALWGLAATYLNEDQFDNRVILGPGVHPVSTLFNEALRGSRGEPNTAIAAINSNHVDKRMMVQLAEFTIHGTADPGLRGRRVERSLPVYG